MGLSLSASRLKIQLGSDVKDAAVGRCLFDIDHLRLVAGHSLALYGPSGSGKTTLLNLLAGLQVQSESAVVWGAEGHTGQDITRLTGAAGDAWRLANAGLVFQQFQLFADMTALENVLTPYRFDHFWCPQAARLRACALLAQFGVPSSALAGRLSRGEQQRVAIARALVREPAVVLADEPTASLDPTTAREVMAVLTNECRRRHVTLVVTTHDASLAPDFDQALVLAGGQLKTFVRDLSAGGIAS